MVSEIFTKVHLRSVRRQRQTGVDLSAGQPRISVVEMLGRGRLLGLSISCLFGWGVAALIANTRAPADDAVTLVPVYSRAMARSRRACGVCER